MQISMLKLTMKQNCYTPKDQNLNNRIMRDFSYANLRKEALLLVQNSKFMPKSKLFNTDKI